MLYRFRVWTKTQFVGNFEKSLKSLKRLNKTVKVHYFCIFFQDTLTRRVVFFRITFRNWRKKHRLLEILRKLSKIFKRFLRKWENAKIRDFGKFFKKVSQRWLTVSQFRTKATSFANIVKITENYQKALFIFFNIIYLFRP